MSHEIKRKQTRLLSGVLIVFMLMIAAFSYYTFHSEFSPSMKSSQTVLPLDKSNPQELWMMRVDSEKQLTEQKMKYLEELVLEKKKHEEIANQESYALKEEIHKFKLELQRLAERPQIIQEPPKVEVAYQMDPFSSPDLQTLRVPLSELIISDQTEKLLHVDQVIPAGTSVKAILVSSVDMPCGVFNASDPQPIKLHLIDDGHLPKQVRAKLKGGILIASAYGDLSNERIYIRIERLTQVRSDGKFIETSVAGYVTGEDGKYGLKGVVVDKSYKMVENAAISGFFSGLNQYLQALASKNCNSCEPGYTIAVSDLASSGVSGGANSAFDMLTNYYIKRAEQIRPVIEASAGRIVDVTFIHNAELGDLHVQEKVRQLREFNRKG
jgi:conjugal transfer pilus assembly protein TraB